MECQGWRYFMNLMKSQTGAVVSNLKANINLVVLLCWVYSWRLSRRFLINEYIKFQIQKANELSFNLSVFTFVWKCEITKNTVSIHFTISREHISQNKVTNNIWEQHDKTKKGNNNSDTKCNKTKHKLHKQVNINDK